jgi:hypothetical protein
VLTRQLVVWGNERGNAIRLRAAPASGGAVSPVPGVQADGPVGGWDLAGQDDILAIHAFVETGRGRNVLFGGPLTEPLQVLADPVATLFVAQPRRLFATGSGVLTVEGAGSHPVLRDLAGNRIPVRLPAGAQRRLLVVEGAIAAVPVTVGGERAIVVFDPITGQEQRRVPVQHQDEDPLALGVSPGGSIAYVGDAMVYWAPEGSTRFGRIVAQAALITPVVQDFAIAFAEVTPAGLERPVVIEAPQQVQDEPARARYVFRGPPTEHVRTLDFDARTVAWSTTHCQLMAPVGSTTTTRLPPGPCVRSEVSFTSFGGEAPSAKRPWLRLGLTCVTSADGVCDVTVRAFLGRRLARARFHVAEGSRRHVVRIGLSPRSVRRAAKRPELIAFTATVRDPDGRRWSTLVR